MGVLSKEEYIKRVAEHAGDSDDDIKFMDDMADTYNALEKLAKENDGSVWKAKYEELDNKWKKKYRERFASGIVSDFFEKTDTEEKVEDTKKDEDITIDDLFEDKKEG